jgi:UDP-2,3-diacylglucosamine pyrophosphatase LpxH
MSPSLQDDSAPKHSIVIISDARLGMQSRPNGKLDTFIKNLDCETLVFNGDIIDGLSIAGCSRKKPSAYDLAVMKALAAQIAQGLKVFYIPGKQHTAVRKKNLYGKTILGITFAEYYVHTTPEGKSFFISQGYQRLLNIFTDATQEKETSIQLTKAFKENISGKKLTVNQFLKDLKLIEKTLAATPPAECEFEEAALARARRGGYDGVICGQTHIPALSTSSDGIIYANAGDWIRHCSALAMNASGAWEILRHEDNPAIKRERGQQGRREKKKTDTEKQSQSHDPMAQDMAAIEQSVWLRKNFSSLYNGYDGA